MSDWPLQRKWLLRSPTGEEREVSTAALASERVLVLKGPAGTGKSTELRLLAKADEALGRTVRTASLSLACASADTLAATLTDLLTDATPTTVLLLDGLDEALAILPHAVIPLKTFIDGPLKTAGVVMRIACRSAVWPQLLEIALGDTYPQPVPEEHRPRIPTADLQPLSDDDIHIAATCASVPPDAFVDAVKASNVRALAEHPVTLRLLLREFANHSSLPASRTALFEKGVISLVQERGDRRELGHVPALSVEQQLDAAARLACFTVLTGRAVVDLNDIPSPSALSLLDLSSLRPPMPEAALLSIRATGLFDSDGPRRFAFAHRQFAEFLAGRHIATTLLHHQAAKLLASSLGPEAGIAGPLRETAAFAAHYSDELLTWIARTDPEVVAVSEIAGDKVRREATLALLDRFRKHHLTDSQLHRDDMDFGGLKYAGAEKDLKPILAIRDPASEDLLECAIALIEQWGLTALANDLATLVLDSDASHECRKSAGYALAKMPPNELARKARRRLLPLLTENAPQQPTDLVGLALRCLWPDHLTDTQLLAVLPTTAPSRYVGALDSFFYHLDKSGFDAVSARVDGLRWATRVRTDDTRMASSEPRLRIIARIARGALRELDDPEVLNALVDLLITGAERGKTILRSDESDDLSKGAFSDNAIRRKLLNAIAARPISDMQFWSLLRDNAGIVALEDFNWIIDNAVSSSLPLPTRTRLAELLRHINWVDTPEYIDRWLAVCGTEPIRSQVDIPRSCPLDPKIADELRKIYKRSKQPRPEKKKRLQPPARDRVLQALEYSETKDPKGFFGLSRELTLDDESTHYGHSRFLTTTPGWKEADDDTRSRIVNAAKRFLDDPTDVPEACRKDPLNSILGGYLAAIFLIQSEDPKHLLERPAAWWQRWAWYIMRELHPHLVGEEDSPKERLLRELSTRAPTTVKDEVMHLLRQPDDLSKSLSTSLLKLIEGVSFPSLEDDLRQLLRQKDVPVNRRQAVAEYLLYREHGTEGIHVSRALLLSLLASWLAIPEEAAPLAVALLNDSPGSAWVSLLPLFKQSSELGRQVLAAFLNGERWQRKRDKADSSPASLPAKLGAKLTGEVLTLLFELFPPATDPEHEGAYFVSPDDSARHARDSLLAWLSNQSSLEAVEAVKSLEQAYGDRYPWLRRPRARAERLYRLGTWEPIPLESIAEVLASSAARLIRSPSDALDGIVECLIELEHRRFQGGNSVMLERLWDSPNGAKPSPKPEEHVSDEILDSVKTYFDRYAVVADREVSLYRRVLAKSEGGLPGDEVDILFTVPGRGTVTGNAIGVPIEVKLSRNRESLTALPFQLFKRYMKHADTDYGMFVLIYMNAPGLKAKDRPLWHGPELAAQYLQEQADTIRRDSAGNTHIRVVVVDASIPTLTAAADAKKKKKKKKKTKCSQQAHNRNSATNKKTRSATGKNDRKKTSHKK